MKNEVLVADGRLSDVLSDIDEARKDHLKF